MRGGNLVSSLCVATIPISDSAQRGNKQFSRVDFFMLTARHCVRRDGFTSSAIKSHQKRRFSQTACND